MLNRMLLIAHRGYSGSAPENTFAAFDLALKLGYRDIEFDVQLSKDGVPVIFHDETLERTTNGSGRLEDKTHAELSQLDAGSWFDPSFAGQRIPSLEEFLSRYRGRAYLHLEIKSSEAGLPHKILRLLESTGWLNDIKKQAAWRSPRRPILVVSSFNRQQLSRAVTLFPKIIILEMLVEKVSDESMHWAAENGLRSYHPDGADITPELVRKAKKLHLRLGAWWWSREMQDARTLTKIGGRYAYVDAPHMHRHPVIRGSQAFIGKL